MYLITLIILFILLFIDSYRFEQCIVHKNTIENEKPFAYVSWSANFSEDMSTEEILLVNPLTIVIFTCKFNAYRYLVTIKQFSFLVFKSMRLN